MQQSTGFLIQQVTLIEHLIGRTVAKPFSWPIIQFPLHFRNLLVTQRSEVGFLPTPTADSGDPL